MLGNLLTINPRIFDTFMGRLRINHFSSWNPYFPNELWEHCPVVSLCLQLPLWPSSVTFKSRPSKPSCFVCSQHSRVLPAAYVQKLLKQVATFPGGRSCLEASSRLKTNCSIASASTGELPVWFQAATDLEEIPSLDCLLLQLTSG